MEIWQLPPSLVEIESETDEELVGDDEADVSDGKVLDEAAVGPIEQRHRGN